MKAKPMNAFWMGMIFMNGWTMCRQDAMGLENYKLYLDKNWVDLHWLFGFSLAMFAIIMIAEMNRKYSKAKAIMSREVRESLTGEN